MSMAALRWCRSVRGVTGTQKLVLWSLADMANDYAEAWPTAITVGEDSCISERAVRDAMDALEAAGFITGERAKGRATRWVLNLDRLVPDAPPSSEPHSAAPERRSGPTKRSAGAVAAFFLLEPGSAPPELGSGVREGSPGTTFRTPPEPRSDPPRNLVPVTPEPRSDITLKNPHRTPIGTPKTRATADDGVVIPSWLPDDAWRDWCQHRTRLKRSGWTHAAAVRCVATLNRLRAEGNDPRAVIDQSIAGGWTGLFALRGHSAAQPKRDRFDTLADAYGVPDSPNLIDIATTRVA